MVGLDGVHAPILRRRLALGTPGGGTRGTRSGNPGTPGGFDGQDSPSLLRELRSSLSEGKSALENSDEHGRGLMGSSKVVWESRWNQMVWSQEI